MGVRSALTMTTSSSDFSAEHIDALVGDSTSCDASAGASATCRAIRETRSMLMAGNVGSTGAAGSASGLGQKRLQRKVCRVMDCDAGGQGESEQ